MLFYVYGYYDEDSGRPSPEELPHFGRVITSDTREDALGQLAEEYDGESCWFGAVEIDRQLHKVRVRRTVEFV